MLGARPRSRAGFTLIELLVVIAIIAILAAIMFPVFVAAKSRGQAGACAANMKQIGQAFTLYLNDWQDRWPSCHFGAHIVLLEPYLRQLRAEAVTDADRGTARNPYARQPYTSVWLCPAAPKDMFYVVKEDFWGAGNGPWRRRYGINSSELKVHHSYVVNHDVISGGTDGGASAGALSALRRPSQTVLMAETCYWRERIPGLGSASTAVHPSGDEFEVTGFKGRTEGCWCRCVTRGSLSQIHPRHGGGANFLWSDMHLTMRSTVPDLYHWVVR